MIAYADAVLHVGSRACMLMLCVACCKHVRVRDQGSRCVYHGAFIWLFSALIARVGRAGRLPMNANGGARATVSDVVPNPACALACVFRHSNSMNASEGEI